ncbi:MAG: hypothetical protein F4158_05700, partial [Synechococcus sp. SB0675_bin_7]|nr:hypothetical protein [Synechococcus sp. SB0675_bin_7]
MPIQMRCTLVPVWVFALLFGACVTRAPAAEIVPTVTITSSTAGEPVPEGTKVYFTLKFEPPLLKGAYVKINGDHTGGGGLGKEFFPFKPGTASARIWPRLHEESIHDSDGVHQYTATLAPPPCVLAFSSGNKCLLSQSDRYQVGEPRSATITVLDNDGPVPVVSFARSSQSVGEDVGAFNVVVNLSPAPKTPFTLKYGLTGTATHGTDYNIGGTDAAGTVSVPAGATKVNIPVSVIDNDAQEGDKTIVLTLTEDTPYKVAGWKSATISVIDDDKSAAVAVELSIPKATVKENEPDKTGEIRLALSRGLVSGEALAVPLEFTGGAPGSEFTLSLEGSPAGVSFDSTGSTVTFTGPSVGKTATVATLSLAPVKDADNEHKTVTVSIPARITGTGLAGEVTGSRRGSSRIHILEPFPLVTVTSNTAGAAVPEGTPVEFTLNFDPPPRERTYITFHIETPKNNYMIQGYIWAGAGTTSTIISAKTPGLKIGIVGPREKKFQYPPIPRSDYEGIMNSEEDVHDPDGEHEWKITLRRQKGFNRYGTYRLGTPSSATMKVTDNDGPVQNNDDPAQQNAEPVPPELSLSSGAGGTEGAEVLFMLSAAPAP